MKNFIPVLLVLVCALLLPQLATSTVAQPTDTQLKAQFDLPPEAKVISYTETVTSVDGVAVAAPTCGKVKGSNSRSSYQRPLLGAPLRVVGKTLRLGKQRRGDRRERRELRREDRRNRLRSFRANC